MYEVFNPLNLARIENNKPSKPSQKTRVRKSKKSTLDINMDCVFCRVQNSWQDLDEYLADHMLSKYDLLQICKSCKKCNQFINWRR
jgi:hypothetical protein